MKSLTLATILLGLVFQSVRGEPRSTTSPAKAGDSLIVGEGADAETLGPLFSVTGTSSQVIALLFLQLAKIEPDLSYSPSLARSWEFSDDRLTLTFRLRDDVLWHDGVKTTAHDVKFTYDLHTNPEVNYPSARWKTHIEECVVDDEYTVRFVFDKSYSTQLSDANVG
ncbi:MAG: ABC transporter substrate-binding protein, partial [Planctomycetota bacterium]|nr:ABC transporter substrate-binding protein [Planctomycetota bacterium]